MDFGKRHLTTSQNEIDDLIDEVSLILCDCNSKSSLADSLAIALIELKRYSDLIKLLCVSRGISEINSINSFHNLPVLIGDQDLRVQLATGISMLKQHMLNSYKENTPNKIDQYVYVFEFNNGLVKIGKSKS